MHAADIAAAEPPVGAGIVAAQTVALAAGLCESLTRTTLPGWADARGVLAQATHLRHRAGTAREDNLATYTAARDQLRTPAAGATGRDGMLRAALLASADTLLAIEAAAADTAALAALLAHNLAADLRADAVGAAELAVGAATTAARLLDINLALGADDDRRRQCKTLLSAATESCTTAKAALA